MPTPLTAVTLDCLHWHPNHPLVLDVTKSLLLKYLTVNHRFSILLNSKVDTEGDEMLTQREQKGLEIAALSKVTKNRKGWVVPSQSGSGAYEVRFDTGTPQCNCPDFGIRGLKCKHIYAVEFTIKRETKPDGTTTVTKSIRVTYKQDWHNYNLAQTHEGEWFVKLLHGLCDGIQEPLQFMGRPRLPLNDKVFSAVLKVYSGMSGRRVMSDVRECQDKGHLQKAPSFTSTFRTLEDATLTPIRKALIEESASPLKAVETDFAVDSSGFSTSVYSRWYDAKYGKIRSEQQWLKAHLMVGVKTNIVTSVEVTDGSANDSPYLPQLASDTAKQFQIDEISGDKGYISKRNLDAIVSLGAVPYIPFKENNTVKGQNSGVGSITSTSSTGKSSFSITISVPTSKPPSA